MKIYENNLKKKIKVRFKYKKVSLVPKMNKNNIFPKDKKKQKLSYLNFSNKS